MCLLFVCVIHHQAERRVAARAQLLLTNVVRHPRCPAAVRGVWGGDCEFWNKEADALPMCARVLLLEKAPAKRLEAAQEDMLDSKNENKILEAAK